MTAPRDPAGQLLASQLEDLIRYGRIIEAQQAVLRMEDAGLLDSFSQEADRLVGDITVRDGLLKAYRVASQWETDPPEVARLRQQVDRELIRTGKSAAALADQMEAQALEVANEVSQTTRELAEVLKGYGSSGGGAPSASHFDRIG